jgi:EmrB/QacA subfamily drug resistance transporter
MHMEEAVAMPPEHHHTTVSIRDTVSGRRLVFVLVGVILGMLLAALDGTIVGTAMPTIVASLGGLAHYSWVFTAYMLASTVTVLIYGKLSDIYGRRLFFLIAMILFLIGSALSGLSHSMTQLILFRALQGLGAGGLMPIAMAIIGDIFPPAQRAKWGAGLTAIFGLATIIGPSLGGIITDNLGWQWVFYVNMPIGAVAILTTCLAMPGHGARRSHTIDYLGVAALSAWSIPLLLAFSLGGSQYAWASPQIIGMIAVAVVMLGVFLFVESRAAEPVLSLGIFKNRIFTVSMIATFLTAMGMFGAVSYLPLFVQGVIGASASNAGAVITPMMMGFIVSSMISGQVLARTGRYKIMALVGFAVGAVGMLLLARMGVNTTNGAVVQRMVITGLGIGVSMSLFTIVVQNAFPLSQMGAVTAALTFFRSIGGTIGVAILGSVMTNRFNSSFDGNLPDALKQRVPPEQLAALKNPQILLSHDATDTIHTSFAAFGAQSDALFNQLMFALRQSLATAITSLFFAAMIAMLLAFVSVIFLKEIPLRKTNAPETAVAADTSVIASPTDVAIPARAASAAASTLAEQPGPVAAMVQERADHTQQIAIPLPGDD